MGVGNFEAEKKARGRSGSAPLARESERSKNWETGGNVGQVFAARLARSLTGGASAMDGRVQRAHAQAVVGMAVHA